MESAASRQERLFSFLDFPEAGSIRLVRSGSVNTVLELRHSLFREKSSWITNKALAAVCYQVVIFG
jgi:hypothetical protein